MSTEKSPSEISDKEFEDLIMAGRDIGLNAVRNASALTDTTTGELAVLNGMLGSVIGCFALVSGSTIIPGNEAEAKRTFRKFVNFQYNENFKIGQKQ